MEALSSGIASLSSSSVLHLSVSTLVDRNAAVAEVIYVAERAVELGKLLSGGRNVTIHVETGSSKRDKGDVFSPEAGEQLAVARALRKLAHTIEREAIKNAPWST